MRLAVAGATGTVGRHVVAAAERAGHDVVPLSRSAGTDLLADVGVAAALAAADAVVDVTSTAALGRRRSVAFFTRVTEVLLRAERLAEVPHHLALSVVGIDRIDAGYYAGKLRQEALIAASPQPSTVLRAAQFHEFAGQVAGLARLGRWTAVPRALVRPMAAEEVGARLVELAAAPPSGRAPDLVGPRDEVLASMVRRLLDARGDRSRVVELALPGRYWRGLASGALRGDSAATRGTLTFDNWLAMSRW
ncbi:SDR family oxidoreductase [Amnibacterium setariae]|uniref:SDR family oxidoreductase n=1 Tax=Amnibacterium setariae TaxID=2306585 RepID=A0A3A1U0G3_9MICO|nr:SDR family oxidoreductase [Amnibacterium setariae]RIX28415.1 SDR family oxidoreductase [Amnibacterium setariae]